MSRADCRAISTHKRTTAHFTVVSTVLCSGYVVNWLLCAYEHDFGGNYIITIVWTGLTTKTFVAVLSVLNLVSDFVNCNHLVIFVLPLSQTEYIHIFHLPLFQTLRPPCPVQHFTPQSPLDRLGQRLGRVAAVVAREPRPPLYHRKRLRDNDGI
jgi:hypothetical protein